MAIEATTGWRWVWRELVSHGFDVRLAEPVQARALLVALELAGEEDREALQRGLVTWRSLAADELADLARALRGELAAGE